MDLGFPERMHYMLSPSEIAGKTGHQNVKCTNNESVKLTHGSPGGDSRDTKASPSYTSARGLLLGGDCNHSVEALYEEKEQAHVSCLRVHVAGMLFIA
jgi:hypothetical protein